MGQKQIGGMGKYKDINLKKEENKLTKNCFEFLYVIGKGGFGKVWKVQAKKYKKLYALKEMSKAKIVDKKSEKSVRYERELLARLKHPFIVNMQYAFQDFENLYIVLDLLTGGDLRYHVSRYRKFTEEQTKFFMACIILSLEYIHNNSIIHRDIKPENLVLDDLGYVGLTDFGIAKIYQKENSSETSGTPGYMAPEVMCAQNHTQAVDYFALGVIGFEFMLGKRPYLGKSRKEIKEQIMARQARIKSEDLPENWTPEAADFINKLLQRKPINRLGMRGSLEVKEHPWFLNYPWKDLISKKLKSPFIPKPGDNFDKNYTKQQDNIGQETLERYEKILRDENTHVSFKDFTYINLELIEEHHQELVHQGMNSTKDLTTKANPVKLVKKDLIIKHNKSVGMLPNESSAQASVKKIGPTNSIQSTNSATHGKSASIGSGVGLNVNSDYKFKNIQSSNPTNSTSTMDNKATKLKKSTSSLSSSSLLKPSYRQLSNLSSHGVNIVSNSNLQNHKRTISASKPLSSKTDKFT